MRPIFIVAVLALAGCQHAPQHADHHTGQFAIQPVDQAVQKLDWLMLVKAEQTYAAARTRVEMSLDRLRPGQAEEAQQYNDRAQQALFDVRRAYDDKDAVLFERALGILNLNSERLKNLAAG